MQRKIAWGLVSFSALVVGLCIAAALLVASLTSRALASGVPPMPAIPAPTAASGHPAPSCPERDRRPLVSRRAGADRSLVPPGATVLIVCRYSGLREPFANPLRGRPPFTPVADARVADPAAVAGFVAALNALLAPPAYGAISIGCPADFGARLIAVFGYGSGPDVFVTAPLSGCPTITNGIPPVRCSFASRVGDRLRELVPVRAGARAVIRGSSILCGPAPERCRAGTIAYCPSSGEACLPDSVTVSGSHSTVRLALRRGRFSLRVPPPPEGTRCG